MYKKNLFLTLGALLSLSLMAQNSAPSSHLLANDNGSGDILMKTVRATITTNATYFCTMQWNAGQEGGAYCGFQDSPDKGHLFIYSIWDPTNRQSITAKYKHPGTEVVRFGGEGNGLKSTNSTIGWNLNEWNTVVTRRWNVGSHTYYGFWIRRGSQNTWYHMVTMDYPVGGVTFNGRTNAFLEDWLSTGANKRRFEIKDGFKRRLNGSWQSMSQATYSRNTEDRSSNYTNKVDAGVRNGAYFMQSGGNTNSSFSGNPPKTFNNNSGTTPNNPAIAFSITNANNNSVSWNVPKSSTPQFRYTIKVNGNQVASSIATEANSASINAGNGSTIAVTLEDILGRTTTKTIRVSTAPPPSSGSLIANGTYRIKSNTNGVTIASTSWSNWQAVEINEANYDDQKWNFRHLGNDIYEISLVANGRRLEVPHGNRNNGTLVVSTAFKGVQEHIKWKISKIGNNYFFRPNHDLSKAMDIRPGDDRIHIWNYNTNNKNQWWNIVRVNGNKQTDIPRKISISPNPANQLITLSGVQKDDSIAIYDINGRIIFEDLVKTTSGTLDYDISTYHNGFYIVKVNTERVIKLLISK